MSTPASRIPTQRKCGHCSSAGWLNLTPESSALSRSPSGCGCVYRHMLHLRIRYIGCLVELLPCLHSAPISATCGSRGADLRQFRVIIDKHSVQGLDALELYAVQAF